MSHDGDQTALGIERPRTGMFTFDKSGGKNSLVVSGAILAHTHTHYHIYIRTHTPSIYGDLNLALWWASEGGYLQQMSSEKHACLKSHPQKECTPAWILHRLTPRGAQGLTQMYTLLHQGKAEARHRYKSNVAPVHFHLLISQFSHLLPHAFQA